MAAALIGFVVVLTAAAGCGMALLRALHAVSDSLAEQWVLGSATGLGLLAYAVLAVGLAGQLRPPVLLAVVLLEAALGAPALMAWARALLVRSQHGGEEGRSGPGLAEHSVASGKMGRDRRSVGSTREPSVPAAAEPETRTAGERPASGVLAARFHGLPGAAALALLLVCLLLVAITLVGALAPPNGDDWDSLAYHLAAPKIYLAHHRIFFIPYDSHTNFPFTMEMLYTVGLVYGGAAGAKLFHWAAGWLTALGIAAFARRLFPSRAAGAMLPVWGPPLAAALFLSIPQVQWLATTAYIDLGTTLYQFLALVAFVYAVWGAGQSAAMSRAPTPWLIVSGLMSGWAMGTKMTALLPFGLLVVAALLWAGGRAFGRSVSGVWVSGFADPTDRADLTDPTDPPAERPTPNIQHRTPNAQRPVPNVQGRREAAAPPEHLNRWGAVAAMVLVGMVVASPWYVKSYLWTHNPVYPFFYSLFPRSVGWTREAEIAYQHEQHFFGLGRGPGALLMAPWDLAMLGWAYFTVPTRWAPPGTLPYFDGLRRGGLSATFLALAPLALFTRRWDRRLSGLILYALALLLPWFFLSQQSRYLLPITAALAVVAAAVVANLEADLPRWAAGALVAAVLCLHVRWGFNEIVQRTWPVVSGQVSRQEYRRRTFSPYEAMQYLNSLPARTRVAMYQETRGFYLNRPYLWANPLQNTLIPYERLQTGAALVQFLKRHLGVTHVLINTAGLEGTENTQWWRLLKRAIDHGDLVPVFAAHGVEVYAIP